MRNKKGFSLVELLVAMAIIAVLISIAAYGIGILQRNQRNTMRRKEVDNIRLVVTESELNSGQEIDNLNISGTTVQVRRGTTVVGSYVVNGFTISAGAVPTCTFATETNTNTLALCFNNSTREIGTNIEGSALGFKISLGQ